MSLTLQVIQDRVEAIYNNSPDTPATTDDDWSLRTILVNTGIDRWQNDNGFLWDELWAKWEDAADGDKTISTGTTAYAAPTNFRYPGGFIELWSGSERKQRIRVVKSHEIQILGDAQQAAYITGNKSDGYSLNLNVAPVASENGYTIKAPYYKYATSLSGVSDTAEMSDGNYLVHFVVSELHKADRNTTGYTTSLQEAEERLKEMERRQMQRTWYQMDIDPTPGMGNTPGTTLFDN